MTIVRRTALIALLFCVPPLLTWLMYRVSTYVLHATSRTIDTRVLWYAGVVELLLFFFIAILEVKDRW